MLNSFLFRFVMTAVLAASFLPTAFGQVDESQCQVDFYYTPGCEQCRQIGENIFLQIRELFGDRVSIRKHNLYDSVEYAEMLKTRATLNVAREDNVFFIVDGQIYVGGLKDIRDNLIPTVEERLLSGSRFAPPGQARAERPPAYNAMRLPAAIQQFRAGNIAGRKSPPVAGGYSFPYSFVALLMAGLVDGVNPCAFATIIFLISSLLAGGGRRENLFVIGLGFCSSVYLTYFLLGLGMFQIFRLSFMRLWLGTLVNWLLIVGLLFMAFVSFRDARHFRRTGRQNEVVLKLPGGLSRLIHNVIRSNLPRKHYFAGGFFLGCMVTILESVCTGQLYLPALAFLAHASPLRMQALAGLALYNLMFILPLIIVFFIGCRGAQYSVLIAWSKKEFFWAKCTMGCFFVFLAILLYLA